MKKLILILITLTTLTNVSYASFPITESLQTEVVESAELSNYRSGNPIWGILSILSAVLGILLIALGSPASLLLFLLAIVFGAIGFKHKPNGLAIAGFIIGILPFAIFILFLIIALIGVLFFDWSFMIM